MTFMIFRKDSLICCSSFIIFPVFAWSSISSASLVALAAFFDGGLGLVGAMRKLFAVGTSSMTRHSSLSDDSLLLSNSVFPIFLHLAGCFVLLPLSSRLRFAPGVFGAVVNA